MSIQKLTEDLNIIAGLDNQPTLTPTQLKAKFDEASNIIKDYINNTLVDAIEDAVEAVTGSVDTAIATKLQAIYPVGRVIYSESNINPASIFGFGTWELTGQGQFIVGYDSTNSKFNQGGKTGGSLSKTLTASQIPSLNISTPNVSASGIGNFDYSEQSASFTRTAVMGLQSTTSQGQYVNNNQQAVDITPTYKTMYMYKRVA